MIRRGVLALAVGLLPAAPVAAQAFTPPEGVGDATLGVQFVENTGHRLSDGNLVGGTSVTAATFTELEYGFTDRVAASLGLAYVFAKWTDENPPPFPIQPVDACHCWNSAFQDFSLSVRYRFLEDPWAVTPIVRLVLPSHSYETQGEAVVGRNLRELQVGFGAAFHLPSVTEQATLQAGYAYSFVQKVLGVPLDRSNGYFELGWAIGRRWYLRADARWQVTHGGLRAGYLSGDPFPPPGEIDTPERVAEHDRMLRDNYWRVGGSVTYSFGAIDAFAAFSKYVAGTDTHNGQAWTAGLTWYFDWRVAH